jgi:hypothetical protein
MTERATELPGEITCPFAPLVDRRVLGDASSGETASLEAHVAQGCLVCAPRLREQDRLERLILGAFRPLEHEIEHRRGPVVDRVKDALAREDARRDDRRRRRIGINAIFFFIVAIGLILIAAEYAMYAAGHTKMVRAQRAAAETEVHAVAVALERYGRERGRLPDESVALAQSLGEARVGSERPYYSVDARRVKDGRILDPWGRPYVYKRTVDGALVYSFGPNGRDEEGEGDDVTRRLIFTPR